MNKSKYDSISLIDKERLTKAYDNDENWVQLSMQLGIKLNSARNIIQKWKKTKEISHGPRGGSKPKINTNIGNILVKYVESDPLHTLQQLKQFLHNDHGMDVSMVTISRYLDGKCLSMKLVRDVPANRNSMSTKQLRFDYVKHIIDNGITYQQSIFIDECGFNLWIRRSFGRSQIGSRCYRTCHGQRGKNISVCMAIADHGIVHYKINVGAFDAEKYQSFIDELSILTAGVSLRFVMDNCRIHNRVTAEEPLHSIVFLPPYSPFLSPIEGVFNHLKSKVKVIINHMVSQPNLSALQRQENLMKIIKEKIIEMQSYNFENHYRHCSKFHVQCIQQVDIMGD